MAWLLFVVLACPLGASAQEDIPEIVRTLIEQADRDRDRNRIEDAIAKYREVIKQAPGIAGAYVSLGGLYHKQGKLQDALDTFARGLERSPADPALLFNAGALELQLGRPEAALPHVTRAVELAREDSAAHYLHGTVLRRLNRPAEAVEAFQTAIKLDPKDSRAQFNLGNTYYELGRHQDAISAYRAAIKIDRAFLSTYHNLGAVLFEVGEHDQALAAYEVALAPAEKAFAAGQPVDPAHARSYLNLGAIHMRKQNWPKALDAFQKSAKLDPSNAQAPFSAGMVHYQLGQLDEAYQDYLRALERDPALPVASLHLGLIELGRNQLDAAVKRIDAALSHLDADAKHQALLALAQAHAARNERDAAITRYRQALADRPNDAVALVGLGRLLRAAGQLADARTMLDRGRQAGGDAIAITLELAVIARTEGNVGAEKTLYRELLEGHEGRPELWPVRVNLVGLLLREGALADATREIQDLIRRLPRDNRAAGALPADVRRVLHTTHGVLLLKSGDRAGAQQAFDEALDRDPSFAPAAIGLAIVNALNGNAKEAASALTQIAGRPIDASLGAFARANLGELLWLLGRADEGESHLRAAVKTLPGAVSMQLALGEIALAREDYRAAIDRLSAAAELCAPSRRSTTLDASTPNPDRFLQVLVGGPLAAETVCARARQALGLASVGAAVQRISGGNLSPVAIREARDLIDRAVGLPLDAQTRAKTQVLRGTLNLLAAQPQAARDDLTKALAGNLPEELKAVARTNLGVALYRTGAEADAHREFEAARAMRNRPPAATLNLAIAYHERGEGERALMLYEEYLRGGGSRRDDVRTWIDDLRRIYR